MRAKEQTTSLLFFSPSFYVFFFVVFFKGFFLGLGVLFGANSGQEGFQSYDMRCLGGRLLSTILKLGSMNECT